MSLPITIAQAAEGAPRGGGLADMLILLVPMVVVLWLMSRWAKKKESEERKKREEMLDALRKKDSAVTIGGINGEVVSVSDKYVVLRVDPQKDVRIRFEKTSIKSVNRKNEDGSRPGDEPEDSEKENDN